MSGAIGEMETKMSRRGRGLGRAVCVGEQTNCMISVGSTRVRGAAGPAASTAHWPCRSVYTLAFPGQSPALLCSLGPAFDLPFFLTSYFGIILDLETSYKDSTESSHTPITQLPLMFTSYITMEHLSELRN